ncbi:hypothetical protein FQR65_LT20094 [Abscondita terminalis]|nr:hypothetical protein FQR65_LT20094 [Abscondita terminalis]
MFENSAPGTLLPIHGTDPQLGEWTHLAFLPDALPTESPELSTETYLAVTGARAALGALDATARQLPNPTLFRTPALRREAQSTSALEGTYAPLSDVFTADEDAPSTPELTEVLNYVSMANLGFARVTAGHPLSVTMLAELQGLLMRGTPQEDFSGRLRDRQVVIGLREGADPLGFPVHASRFVPAPASPELEIRLRDLTDWMRADHSSRIDPVVAAAMAHYQFETLHPFHDGNGRVGRYLVVLHLQMQGVLSEPTLTVSPWFEARRPDYYDRLLAVSTRGDWDAFVRFFARGIKAAADTTRQQMLALVRVQGQLTPQLNASALRAKSAHALIEFAVANPSFTVRRAAEGIGLSYGRVNALVSQLVELEILKPLSGDASYQRRFYAPSVLSVLTANARVVNGPSQRRNEDLPKHQRCPDRLEHMSKQRRVISALRQSNLCRTSMPRPAHKTSLAVTWNASVRADAPISNAPSRFPRSDLVRLVPSSSERGLGGFFGMFIDNDPGDRTLHRWVCHAGWHRSARRSYYREEQFAERSASSIRRALARMRDWWGCRGRGPIISPRFAYEPRRPHRGIALG